jgi:23S rRNA (pseudouridine1915-N3)-methyltransferase
MRLVIVAVGRLKAGPERELLGRYLDRANAIGKALALHPLEAIELNESPAPRAPERQADEAKRLGAAVPAGFLRVALDERGQALSSDTFAGKLGDLRDRGTPGIAFLIGGADGLAAEVRKSAAFAVAYGAATFPHQIVRILLAEQLYRAMTILSGHPYHRGN